MTPRDWLKGSHMTKGSFGFGLKPIIYSYCEFAKYKKSHFRVLTGKVCSLFPYLTNYC